MASSGPTSKPADPYKASNQETDIPLKQKVDDLDNFMIQCKFGMMTTRDANSGHLMSRCMALAATETKGLDLLFFTNTQSHKTKELASDPHVNVAFLNASGEWASVAGTSAVVTDRAQVKQYYTPTLRAWLGDLGDGTHDGSEDDPRLGIIRVTTSSATYSLVKKNMLGRIAEVVHGAVTGKVAEVNRLREITAEDVKQWRSQASMQA